MKVVDWNIKQMKENKRFKKNEQQNIGLKKEKKSEDMETKTEA